MSDNLVWHSHDGDRCPVPLEALVFYKYKRRGDEVFGPFKAEDLRFGDDITAFAIDPSQSPRLDGPLEVGASYIRRDGDIVEIEGPYNDWWRLKGRSPQEAVDSFGFRYTAHDPMTWDLLCRYYANAPAAVEAPKTAVTVGIDIAKPGADKTVTLPWIHKAIGKPADTVDVAKVAMNIAGAPQKPLPPKTLTETYKAPPPKPPNTTEQNRIARALGTVANDRNVWHLSGTRMGRES